jgi:signal transduction histidine kinase
LVADRTGRRIRVSGWPTGTGAALRLRPANLIATAGTSDAAEKPKEPERLQAVLAMLADPAFLRDADRRLVFANTAYRELTASAGGGESGGPIPELLDQAALQRHLDIVGTTDKPRIVRITMPDRRAFDLVEVAIPDGSVGLLRPRADLASAAPAPVPVPGHIAGVIDALATPVAIFDARRELIHFNPAYAALWNLEPRWLATRPDERDILDRLRTAGQLPAEPNYQVWRDRHLGAYQLTAPRVSDPWHLPDGRTIVVTAAPAGPQGGVIYVFEDQTARLELESRNRALASVQRETLNALGEGVAVFGTNGRLTLSNPRLSVLWKLPANELARSPHIDRIAELAAAAMPEDGSAIWRDLKRRIVDLNPTRSDAAGRISRADGRLLDYAVVRLPDGQTLITFQDVTESASYSRVLKERNEALVTADRLKDAFVQNVSYELRSPLTNIIGFADLLASGTAGPLNDRQRAYTGYIRASSETLGVLIDNILDLATVDAGIAELRPELQDVAALVDKARAGLAATFPEIDGDRPVNLVIDIAPDLPAFRADGTRLVQILYNLLSNAARFSEPGGEIRLSVRPRGRHMQFVVEDSGAEMSEEIKAAILDQAGVLSGRQRGAGLGLAIVRSFVNLHGGTIAVEPREPHGTRVVVNLPLDAGAAIDAAE